MTERLSLQQVIALLESCVTAHDWELACRQVKAEHGGEYPDYWYDYVSAPRLIEKTAKRWGWSVNDANP